MPKCAPAIYTIHDLPPARFPDEGNLPVWSRQAAQTAEVIITPSQFAKEEVVDVLKVPPGRVHVIPNGVEHELFGPTTHEATEQQLAGHGLSKPFVIYAGGFTRRKNVPALLAAWHKVSAEHPNLSLALVGPGSQLQKLCEEVDAPRTVIVGHLGRSEIASLMKAATAVVVPSVYEGFGLPALEGMALGVPVMAVRAGAIPEVVGDAALLVEDGSPEILAEGLLTILKDSTLAATLRRDGPIRARQFSWEKQARAVLDVYQRVLS